MDVPWPVAFGTRGWRVAELNTLSRVRADTLARYNLPASATSFLVAPILLSSDLLHPVTTH
jgi:hypothetical protein